MSVDYSQSISEILLQFKEGDSNAIASLWKTFFERLLYVARSKMHGSPNTIEDAEDVLISVFRRIWDGAKNKKFGWVEDESDLWKLLIGITKNRIRESERHATRKKRSPNMPIVSSSDQSVCTLILIEFASDEPTPDLLVALCEEFQVLLSPLPEYIQEIVLLRLEGYTPLEIEKMTGKTVVTVQRILRELKELWERRLTDPS